MTDGDVARSGGGAGADAGAGAGDGADDWADDWADDCTGDRADDWVTHAADAADDPEVRAAGPEDWAAWREIRLAALRHDPDAFGSTVARELAFDANGWRDRLTGENGPSFLALAGGRPVGMGAGWTYRPGHLMVVAMWTEPAWRGHGIGGRILDKVVDWAHQRDLRVDLWVADSNPAARALYERRGFRPNGEQEPLREGAAELKSRLVLPLAAG